MTTDDVSAATVRQELIAAISTCARSARSTSSSTVAVECAAAAADLARAYDVLREA